MEGSRVDRTRDEVSGANLFAEPGSVLPRLASQAMTRLQSPVTNVIAQPRRRIGVIVNRNCKVPFVPAGRSTRISPTWFARSLTG